MRTCWVQFKRELGAILLSPIAYVLLVGFTMLNAFAFQLAMELMSRGMRNLSIIQLFFGMFFVWFLMILFIPIMTMRLFSEEYKSGTIEMLLTAPIQEWEVVLAKFFGALAFYMVLWAPSVLFYVAFQTMTNNQLPANWPAMGMAYGMVFLIGMFYISIGLFASSLTKNQIIAAVVSFAGIALLFFTGFLAGLTTNSYLVEMLNYISARNHLYIFSNGTFDTRPVIFYLSGTVLFLILTERTLAIRKLKA